MSHGDRGLTPLSRRQRLGILPLYWSLSLDLLMSAVIVCALAGAFISLSPAYIAKARLTELFAALSPLRVELILGRAVRGTWPEVDMQALLPQRSRIEVSDVLQSEGHFTFVFRLPAQGDGVTVPYNLSFRRAAGTGAGSVVWWCGYHHALIGTEPTIPDITTVPPAYLPGVCR
jgi:hypothetical protein